MSDILLQLLDIKKIYKSDNKSIEALKGVSLNIYKKEILGLLGVNGAGKTTLSSIIAALHPPTSGDIILDNKSIYQDIVSYKEKLGFCPQKPNFEKFLTVEENLIFAGHYYLMPREKIRKRVASLLEQFNLAKYAKSYPYVLSGGYKQRLLIARALIHEPLIVILDEPTVGLDPSIRRQLWKDIADLKEQGTSVILTTHYLDEAEILSDRICMLDNGLIKAVDTPENLKSMHDNKSLEDIFVKLSTTEKNNE